MHHRAIEKFISELKLAKFPYFTSDTQVICGRVTLTATPSIDSERVHSFRLDLPEVMQPSESPYWILFVSSVWDWTVAARIMSEVHHDDEHVEVIGDWRFRVFTDDGHPVFAAEAMNAEGS
jgi:hypothetical protein